jgi:nucleotide-binding universal stress UspA family protein
MLKILLPTDGSPSSVHAAEYVAKLARSSDLQVEVLNVQPPLPAAAAGFVPVETVKAFHEEEGEKALADTRAALETAGVRHRCHVAVGDAAETIVDQAAAHGCDQIIMGSRGLSPVPNLLLGSTTTKVLHLSTLPVTIVRKGA